MKRLSSSVRVGVVVVVVWACVLAGGARAAAAAGHSDREILRAMSRAVAQVAAEVRPAVVSIHATRTVRVRSLPALPRPPGFGPSPFDEFFRDRFGRRPGQPGEREFRQRGLGSGFIIDAEKGHILTNHHVVAGAEDIKVRLSDKREFDARLVGSDKKTDLAVIRIEADGLKELRLGDSDKLAVGEFVFAVGSPFGLRETISMGIVSAKGRSNLGIEAYEDFIQTDAAINVGNSGGPLVNIDGEAVGVSTAIISRAGGFVGVGLAIPVNMAKGIVEQLIESGRVTRGWLGVMIQDLTPEMAERFGLDEAGGALVGKVLEGTPAAEAGIQAGDVIVAFAGREVESVAKLRSRVAATAPGAEEPVTVFRDGERKTLTVTIGKLSDAEIASAQDRTRAGELGLSVQDLTPELAEKLGVDVEEGVAVTAVEPGGPAEEKGIKPGDVIVEVDREAVRDAGGFAAALQKADLDKGVLLWVADHRGRRFVLLKPGS